jgi:hypothetical protein
VQAESDGQGHDVRQGPGRVGQRQVAQGVGEQDHHDAERHASAEQGEGGEQHLAGHQLTAWL